MTSGVFPRTEEHRRHIAEANVTHGMSNSSVFTTWSNMRQRCYNKKRPDYSRYGGKGIKVCKRWKTFSNFLEDMGDKPSPKHSIDRIDNLKGYSLKNCRWATNTEQQRNKNNNLKFRGETSVEASLRLGGNKQLISARITMYGWDIERAFTTFPINNRTKLPERRKDDNQEL